jgi:hypothetical protein
MRIGSNGNVGIGTNNLDAKLVVAGAGLVQSLTNTTDQDLKFWLSSPNATDKYALIAPSTATNLTLGAGGVEKMRIASNGNVSIGTTDAKGNKLAVAGSIIATQVKVMLQSQWPDYVFKPSYTLPSLLSVKAYIDKNKHLPEIPSEVEVAKEGVNLGEMNKLLLKKVEELTLYLIEQNKQLQNQQKQINELKVRRLKL